MFQNSSDVQVSELQIPETKQWDTIEKLSREREVIGIYISGHPLDDFKVEMESFCNANVSMFKSPKDFVGEGTSNCRCNN